MIQAASDKKLEDFGANLFVGNLDADVDEKLLYDTFSAFGNIINNTPKVRYVSVFKDITNPAKLHMACLVFMHRSCVKIMECQKATHLLIMIHLRVQIMP